MRYIIWYQVAAGDLFSRVEVTRLDDAQAVWDLLSARGRLMRSARPEAINNGGAHNHG